MKIKFLGATGTVTGSKYLLTTNGAKILIDCGLFQGYKNLRERNWMPFPFDVKSIDAVILTHAHLDHSGMIPILYKNGYRGPVYCSAATSKLCGLLLPDSGHLQEEEAKFRNKHKQTKHSPALPLYDSKTARDCLVLFKPISYHTLTTIKDVQFNLSPVGHILGAASIRVICENKSLAFSGDVGRPSDLVMYDPEPLKNSDYLFIESTYGNRLHESEVQGADILETTINKTIALGGSILIPSFAIGRAQTIMFVLSELIKSKKIPKIPIFLDSPMAINVSIIYDEFNNEHRISAKQFNEINKLVEYTNTVDQSKAIALMKYPHIIISASGMATGGRVLHHLKQLLPDYRNTVVFVGYQAGGTRGRKLLDKAKVVRVFGKDIEVKANIVEVPSYSAHADYKEIITWLKQSKITKPKKVFVVHGEPDASDEFRLHLKDQFAWDALVPDYLGEYEL
jgi:metallo-beta-lactamase family protein